MGEFYPLAKEAAYGRPVTYLSHRFFGLPRPLETGWPGSVSGLPLACRGASGRARCPLA